MSIPCIDDAVLAMDNPIAYIYALIKCIRNTKYIEYVENRMREYDNKVATALDYMAKACEVLVEKYGGSCVSSGETNIDKLLSLAKNIYANYVPDITINTKSFTIFEVMSMVSRLPGSQVTPIYVDGVYVTTDIDTWRKLIEWDWTDTRKYVEDVFDCDNFAWHFKENMAFMFGLNAVAVVYDFDMLHAYNLILDSNGSWWLYEPQTDGMWKVSERPSQYIMNKYIIQI